jgi:hypothetical protein
MLTREWAVRCCLEAETAGKSAFVTLTYNDENLPKDGSLEKAHLSGFMKRLRASLDYHYPGEQVRFYACGEYGASLSRPHYHVLLFGFDFPDKYQLIERGSGNDFLYRSEFLERSWKLGYSSIGDVTASSAAYVAGYIRKKVHGDAAAEHYSGKEPEFSLQSLNPGIGFDWYQANKHWLWDEFKICFGDWTIDPPRYFYKLLKQEDPALYEQAIAKRERLRISRADDYKHAFVEGDE